VKRSLSAAVVFVFCLQRSDRLFIASSEAIILSLAVSRDTKEFISKTPLLSFHGLTGESRTAMDARLRTAGMTDKHII
jgi:hypothetical protein